MYVPGRTNPTTGLYEGHYHRAPTDAEVLAHPAALAEVQRLTGKVDRLTAERTEALTLIAAAGDYAHDQIGPVGLIDAVNNLITDTDELRRQGWREDADVDRLNAEREAFRVQLLGRAYGLPSAIERLCVGADHLLNDHNCDAHGYETLIAARDSAREMLQVLNAYLAPEKP